MSRPIHARLGQWRWVLPLLKWTIIVAVLIAVGTDLYGRWSAAESMRLRPRLGWAGVAGALYLASWLPAAWWWQRILRAMGANASLWDIIQAFYVGHLGKYVPGKAMVVVIRASLLRTRGVAVSVGAASTIYETLSTAAVGAFLATALVLLTPQATMWGPLAVALGLVAGLPIVPGVFNRLAGWMTIPFPQATQVKIGRLGRQWLWGTAALAGGWMISGLSVGATILAIGSDRFSVSADFPEAWATWTSAAALAVVAGFLAIWFPAGIGVREFVLVELLAPGIGRGQAVAAAVLWRLISIVTEAMLGGLLYLTDGLYHRANENKDR